MRAFPVLAACVLGSCASDSGNSTASPTPQTGGQGLEKYATTNPLYSSGGARVADEAGAVGRPSTEYQQAIESRQFATTDYAKKSFWGDKDYAKKVYKGDLDGSRFHKQAQLGQTGARENTMMARDSGRAFDTSAYQTGAAREQSGKRIERISDSETDVRRKVYKQPEITGWREHRALTVEDTNRMLGR